MNSPVNHLYLENAVGRVEEDVRGFIRLQYYPGPRNINSWQALMQHAQELLARQGRGLMLVDQQKMAPFTPDEQTWLLEQWLPSTIVHGGYRYGAILQAHDVFARLAMDIVRTQARGMHLTYHYFTDEAAANDWLLAQR